MVFVDTAEFSSRRHRLFVDELNMPTATSVQFSSFRARAASEGKEKLSALRETKK